jgi:hypothetical protein
MKSAESNKDYVCFRIKGNCMNRPIEADNLLLIKLKNNTAEFKIGDVIVYKKARLEELFAHRLVKIIHEDGNKVYVIKNDSLLLSKTCDKVKSDQIIGKAIAVIKNDKVIGLNKGISYIGFLNEKIARRLKSLILEIKK